MKSRMKFSKNLSRNPFYFVFVIGPLIKKKMISFYLIKKKKFLFYWYTIEHILLNIFGYLITSFITQFFLIHFNMSFLKNVLPTKEINNIMHEKKIWLKMYWIQIRDSVKWSSNNIFFIRKKNVKFPIKSNSFSFLIKSRTRNFFPRLIL